MFHEWRDCFQLPFQNCAWYWCTVLSSTLLSSTLIKRPWVRSTLVQSGPVEISMISCHITKQIWTNVDCAVEVNVMLQSTDINVWTLWLNWKNFCPWTWANTWQAGYLPYHCHMFFALIILLKILSDSVKLLKADLPCSFLGFTLLTSWWLQWSAWSSITVLWWHTPWKENIIKARDWKNGAFFYGSAEFVGS